MEFNDGFPSYETLAQHDNIAGVGVRKKLMNVFWLLLGITLIELCVGWFWHDIRDSLHLSKTWLIIVFIFFTVIKAGYIVMAFMHLGDESKWMKWMILGPYCLFAVYIIYMVTVTEGSYSQAYRDLLDPVTKTAAAPAHGE
jgi:cytochrome c oxidase subunit IV